jgi:hypothetical protein
MVQKALSERLMAWIVYIPRGAWPGDRTTFSSCLAGHDLFEILWLLTGFCDGPIAKYFYRF